MVAREAAAGLVFLASPARPRQLRATPWGTSRERIDVDLPAATHLVCDEAAVEYGMRLGHAGVGARLLAVLGEEWTIGV